MLCSICQKNEAKVHYTKIVGDQMPKVDLCEACAKEKGVSDPGAFAFEDLLLGSGVVQEIEQLTAGATIKCPHCGYSQADFKKSGRLGCAECYATFATGLEGMLKAMHKGTQHVGKAPQALQQLRDCTEKLKSLQKRLDKAVGDEDFEQAATVRDEIKRAKAKLGETATS